MAASVWRFYSSEGQASIGRMLVVAIVVALILMACGQVNWQHGLAINIIVGAIAGAAIGKFVVEAVRRLRDAGISLRLAAWVLVVFGVIAGIALFSFLSADPPWANAVLAGVEFGAPVVCAIALLWPGSAGQSAASSIVSARRGPILAISCILAGALAAGFVAWLSIGMHDANLRTQALEAQRNRESEMR